MNVTISNYRGLASASLDLSRICLLAGPNEAGKTSAAQALTAALTGEPIPVPGVKKTQAGMLVRSGNANGSVELASESGTSNIQWPSAKVKSEGSAPWSSHFATGLQTIVTMDEKERVKVLTGYLKAAPTRADLDAKLIPLGLTASETEKIWLRIEQLGWDGTLKHYEQQRAQLKGQWMEVTGEQYGSKKAESWIPEGYEQGLESQSEDKLKAIVTDARDALEAAIAADAVDDSKRADLEALAALLPARKIDLLAAENATVDPTMSHQLTECEEMIKSISGKRDGLNKEFGQLPKATQAVGMPCPHCNTILQVKADKLDIAAVLSEGEISKRQTDIDELTNKISKLNGAVNSHMEASARIRKQIADEEGKRLAKIAECKKLVAESEAAEKELRTPVKTSSGVSIDTCRRTLAAAELNLKAFTSKIKADRHHKHINAMEMMIGQITPDGIRGDVLVRALKGFNDSIAPFCKAAGWRPVTLEADFMPTMGGTIYLLLSESAKFRVRVALQIGLALIDKSQALVIDAADILDKAGRNGLFKAVKLSGIPALITMTIDGKELVPNLGKAGIGSSYWLNGEATAELIQ